MLLNELEKLHEHVETLHDRVAALEAGATHGAAATSTLLR